MPRNTRIALVALTVLLAGTLAGTARAEEPEESAGAAKSVESSMQKAGTATKNGLDTAGKATGKALDKALDATGKGVGYAIDETGKGLKKAGDSMTGSGAGNAD